MNTEISLVKLKGFSRELEECKMRVRKERQQLMDVRAKLKRLEDEGIAIVVFQLGRQVEKLAQEEKDLQKLRVGLEKIISAYERCEEKILDYGETEQWHEKIDVVFISKVLRTLMKDMPEIKVV